MSDAYVAISALKNAKMSSWWYYEGVRTGKIPFRRINGLIHIPESYVQSKTQPVQDNTWQRQVDAQIMLLKDVLKHNGNDIKNLRDEIVTLRLQFQSLRKSNAGIIRRFWRWLW